MDATLNIDDLRRAARRFLPRGMFEYIDRGTEDETALSRLRRSFDRCELMPRVLVDTNGRSLETGLFGRRRPLPFVVAPTAAAGLVRFGGEVLLARAAQAAGIPFCVSTQSITAIEEIAASGAELWFQLYVWRDRGLTHRLLDRVAACGTETLVLTVDTAVSPKREYNQRNGFGVPVTPSLRGAVDVALHPAWAWTVLLRCLRSGGWPAYAHYPPEFRGRITEAAAHDPVRLCDRVCWSDVAELRRRWKGRIVIKGILSPDDARQAAEAGVDAVVVSNHGGRNLDSAPSPLAVLPRIADEVGDRLTVLADSGVRRGSDAAKLLAAGASAVLLGRAPLFGLAADGQRGAERAFAILADELDRTMSLLGCRSVADLRGCRMG
ncbi:alpha-hydroxy acid oxidase [Azospirillum picis]|uniref:L-lactate dehydrogenase (Cytochrome) n=1 Tax=Azospirillum picis TaxID=488438 RepID=A0ABU0MNL6_9PROT|nr:alpha-hydroxy acid oxidase [Azospirillum picis]MBP2301763.1 L-lactate dehydrogenase (cytochrome) [Azospirillum picis]MDQ0535062.1 L-lactate dehydrogenase (cytochrome) [Azospirillum picis]